MGNVIVVSLQHATLSQDHPGIYRIIDNIGKPEGIRTVFLMNKRGEVRFAPNQQGIGQVYTVDTTGCAECHGIVGALHPFSTIMSRVVET